MGHWIYKDGHPVFIEDKGISSRWFRDVPSDGIKDDDKKIVPNTGIKHNFNSELSKHEIKKIKQENKSRNPKREVIKKIVTKSLVGISAGFLSFLTLNPIPLLAYKTYLAGNLSYTIIKKIEQSDLDKKLVLVKETLKTGIQDIFHLEIKNFVDNVVTVLDSSGFISKVSEETSFEPQFVKDSFENIMAGLLESGMDNIAVPMVDAL